MTSILSDIKHNLGLLEGDTTFDQDVIMHINSGIAVMTQLGVGPQVGYMVTGKEDQWNHFFTDTRLNVAMSYLVLHVKMQMDENVPGPVISARERQMQEMQFRLTVVADYG